jgi:hypothetical protein
MSGTQERKHEEKSQSEETDLEMTHETIGRQGGKKKKAFMNTSGSYTRDCNLKSVF